MSEDIYTVHGKLEQELVGIKKISQQIEHHSLILINELLASTSEEDGTQIAAEVLHAFANTRSNIIFVTHLYELAILAESGKLLLPEGEKAVNYVPDYPETFSNGFRFDNASINNTQAKDSDKNTVDEFKGITFFYMKDGAQENQLMTLSTDPEGPGLTGDLGPNEEVVADGDLDLIYSKVTFKVVPEGLRQRMKSSRRWIRACCGSATAPIRLKSLTFNT
jgi:hypothetical protein